VPETTTADPQLLDTLANNFKLLLGDSGTPEPKIYMAMKDVDVVDLTGASKTITMPKYSVARIVGTLSHDGKAYAIPKSAYDKVPRLWYGIEWVDSDTNLPNLELETEVLNSKTTLTEREATKMLKTLDRIALAVVHSKKILLGFLGFFSKIKPALKK
jgi:hypothetical protein